MPEDRLTREQLLEARLSTLERRVEQLEGWTGADEDGDPMAADVSVAEELIVLRKLVTHLIRMLDFTFPDFTVDRFRNALDMVDEQERRLAKERKLDAVDIDPAWDERMRRIIVEHLPIPVPNDRHPQRRTRTFRPTVVGSETDEEPSAPGSDE